MPPAPTTTPITSPSEPFTPSLYHAAPRGAGAVWLAAGAMAAVWLVQGVLAAHQSIELAMAVSYAAAIAVVYALRRPGWTLGVTRAPARFFAAAIAIGGAGWYVRIRLVEALEVHTDMHQLESAIEKAPLALALIGVALLPAVAEELIFRGVIARAIARRSQWLAIVVSAAIFAAYHILPVQVISVFPFGLALGLLAVRSGSVVPGMVAHALNNACVILVTRPELGGRAYAAMAEQPTLSLVVASAIVAGGVALALPAIGAGPGAGAAA